MNEPCRNWQLFRTRVSVTGSNLTAPELTAGIVKSKADACHNWPVSQASLRGTGMNLTTLSTFATVTVEGSNVLVLTALVVYNTNEDNLLYSRKAEALMDIGVDVTMHDVVLDDVDANTLGLNAVANDDVLLPNTGVNVVRVKELGILEAPDDINIYVVTVLAAEDDMLTLEATAHAEVEVLVPPTMLVDAVCATVEGLSVITPTVITGLDVAGDKLLDSAKAEVLVGTTVGAATNPVVFEEVDARTLVMNTVTDNNVLMLNTFIHVVRGAALVILEGADDVNHSVTAALGTENDVTLEGLDDIKPSVGAAVVADNDVLLLQAVTDANVEVLLPPPVLFHAVSATVEGPGVLAITALPVLTVSGDGLLDSTRSQVTDANVEVLLPPPVLFDVVSDTVEGPGGLAITVLAVLTVKGDGLSDSTRSQVLGNTGVAVAMSRMVPNEVNASTTVLTAIDEDNVTLLNNRGKGVRVAAIVILEGIADPNT